MSNFGISRAAFERASGNFCARHEHMKCVVCGKEGFYFQDGLHFANVANIELPSVVRDGGSLSFMTICQSCGYQMLFSINGYMAEEDM